MEVFKMELSKIFTKKNIEILDLLFRESLHLREIAEKLNISVGQVHNTIQTLKENDLIEEVTEKNKKIIVLNKRNPLLPEIEKLLNVEGVKKMEIKDEKIKLFDTVSPLDFRYYGRSKSVFEKIQPYLSESAFIKYALKVESSLTKVLAKRGICDEEIAREVEQACRQVTPEEVYQEEDRIKHNIRALTNSIQKRVSDKAKPYVHFTTTSHDIICSTDAVRYKEFTETILVPTLIEFQKTLISLAEREKATVQIGRTHGQHAEPITFGFAIAQYISRFGNSILKIKKSAKELRGKIAGAVGAYNASSLFFDDPEEFEREVLAEVGIKPSPISTQVVEAEYLVDYVNTVITSFGILANLSDDMRHLQRSEIGEVGEEFGKKQVGSSTMPHKRNPINFENVKSMWKEIMPRILTCYQDQISEHQRDLTNSASMRFIPEILTAYLASVMRLNRIMAKLVVDNKNLQKNFDQNKEMIVAEPLYILLAAHNHPDAHEYVREKTLESQSTEKPLRDLVNQDKNIKSYLDKFTKPQLEIINNPDKYLGIAVKKTEKICEQWKKEFKI
jgi:adenylosuccinate lyase